ncbi:hypothetical protein CEXT_241411 [Caerostris extrusa]|uniref:Uncharacterized protein n=1 Tax=Caerostris extrusa TaxID=172846 RepID=A0AAV4TLG2_CAEEX|nr:hypothetical protein CEXT_241411 [Caerostris extrusa]
MKGPASISPDHNISILVHFMGTLHSSPLSAYASPPSSPGVIHQKYGWKSCGEEGVMRIFLYPFPPLIPIPFPRYFYCYLLSFIPSTGER